MIPSGSISGWNGGIRRVDVRRRMRSDFDVVPGPGYDIYGAVAFWVHTRFHVGRPWVVEVTDAPIAASPSRRILYADTHEEAVAIARRWSAPQHPA